MGNVARAETVAVIPAGESRKLFLAGKAVAFHQLLDFRLEVLLDLFPSDAAKRGVVNIETDVVKLVEVTEYSHLGELGNAGDEDESQPLVGTFQHGVEGG